MTTLWDRIQDWVILVLLLATSLSVMLTQNRPMMRSVRAGALDVTARVESAMAWMGTYFRALDENDRLRQEAIALSSEVARSREARLENARLRRMLALRDTFSYPVQSARIVSKDLVPARVVDRDITQQRNLLTISVGRADSVHVGMAVIDERGILGKIVLVSDHYARVMPYLNTDFSVPGRIQPIGAEGIVQWEGERSDRLLLEHVSKTEPVLRGQLVVTSGYSGVFPPGLPIGFIDSIAARPGRSEHRLFLRPSSPLSHAEHVFVVLRRPDPEQQALEAQPLP